MQVEAKMTRKLLTTALVCSAVLAAGASARAGQAPAAASAPDIPVSHHDRVYAAEQFSNTVSVTDPADNKLLGVIRLGEPSPANFSPLYNGQVAGAWHGLFARSPHHRRRIASAPTPSLHRHRDQCGKTHHLCWTGAARGVLHARRQVKSGSPCAARTTCPCSTPATYQEKTQDHRAQRPRDADLLA